MGRSGDSHNPGPSVGVTAQGHALAGDSIVLEEEIDPNYVPTQEEVREYAKWLGMDLEDDRDQDLFWIAKEGLKAPLPENWKPCKTMDTDEIYYFNFVTGESTWDHPCDEYYRKLYEEEKKKKLTKDKAKHDKSKLQAKKDMDQLLGRKKRRKKRPEGKKNAQKRSPKNPEVVSTVLDRKPLPGIKRQLLHNCDTPAYDTWKSDQIKLENARSSRTQLSSLVSHRLSQHLSVSVGSDDHDVAGQMSDDHHESFRDGSLRHSADMGPSYSGEKDSGTREEAMGASKMKSQHADALKELRTKHAREVNEMQQAHDDIRCQLEEKHRRHLDLPKSAWAATAEEQSMKAEEALRCGQEKTRELEKMCERHYSEIDTIERDFIDSNARLEEAKAEREKTRKAADTEKHDVEMAMVELGRNIWSEGGFLQEAKNIDHKDHRGHRGGPKDVSSDKGTGRLEFMRVVSELAIERKRVVELEGRLKVVNANVEATTMTDQGSSPLLLAALECEDNTPNVCIEKFTELEGKLAIALRENEDLRSNVARAEGTVQGDQIGSKGQERSELLYLETALEEANTRFSKLEKAKRLSEMEAEDALTALEAMQEKTANLELINCELSKQIVRSRRAAISDGEDGETQGEKCSSIRLELVETQEKLATMRKTHEEYEAELSHRRRECYELRADSARYPEEVQASKRREAVIRNDLKSTQKTLHETELQNEELKSVLATVRQEKAQNASTAARLRLEDTHIREDTEQIHVTAEEPYYRVHDMEVQKLKTYLAGIEKSRDGLNKEVQDLKQKLLASEGSSRTERATFEAESASQKVTLESDKDHIESLQATIKMLESDMETGERKEEAQSSHYTTQREHKSTSMSQEKEERRWAVHLRDRNEKPVAAADLGGIVKYESAEEQSSLASRLHHAEEQIGRLQASLQETRRKLVDAQGVNVSTEDISEDNVKGVAPEGAQEELSEVGGDVVKKLMEEERRRVHTEERLEQACDDRLTLETSLWETVDVQHAHGNELGAAHEERVTCAFLEKEYRNTHSQTEIDRITCDLEGKFAWSQEEVERARASIASREMGIIRLVDWTVRENGAMGDAQRSNKLASDRQEEINTLYKRQQGVLGELDKERINLEHAEEECRHANAAAKEAKDKLLDAEKGSYRDMHELRASLQVTSARADRTQEHDRKSLQQTSPSTIYKYKSGGGYSISRDFESSICATSDGTNQGLADELMHKLTDETSRKRSDKTSRSWEKKLEVEKRVLAVARQMMKHHKQRVRRRQQNILQCQARWRDQQHSRSRRPARRRSLEEAKRKLDREVLELNVYVKQLRHNKTWLDRRERKVFDFEQLLRKQKPWSRGRKEQHSGSCFLESSDAITPDWRSLEALQQELDNDLSDVNQGNGVYQSRETLRQKRSQSQQFAASRGKENVCPTSIPPRGRTRYQMFSPFPAAPDFRERRATPSVGKVDQSSGLPRRRTQECRRRSKAHHCRDGLSNNRTLPKNFAVHDLSMSLEAELQQWLNCPEADPRRRSLADRERTMHLTKLKEEGRQAQSTVALHVDWLNSLRQEMGLLGSYGAESSMPTRVRATSVADISPAVDALISPRRVVKASLLGSLQARDV